MLLLTGRNKTTVLCPVSIGRLTESYVLLQAINSTVIMS